MFEQELNEQIADEFKRRRTRQLIVTPFIVLAILFMVWSEKSTGVSGVKSPTMLQIITFVIIVGAIIFSLFNWRCPSCKGYLGKAINPKFCVKCGTQLR